MHRVFIAAILALSLLLHSAGESNVSAKSLLATSSAFGYTHQISTGLTPEQMGYLDLHAQFGINPDVIRVAGSQQNFSYSLDTASFIFPFFDQAYSTFFISSYGVLVLGGTQTISHLNSPVPGEATPNNVIAPFWDDLYYVQSPIFATIYILQGSLNNQEFLAVEWYRPSRYGAGTDDFTFEAILWENGDITFNYLQMNGDVSSASVGFEESQGVDGISFYFNEPGLTAGTQIQIIRPPDGPSLKVIPTFQSAFLNFHTASLPLTVTNTGANYFDGNQDVFEIHALNLPADWDLQIQDALGSPLQQISANVWETPSILDQESIDLVVKVRAPDSVLPGEFRQLDIEVVSRNAAAQGAQRYMTSTLQVAIPVPFTQIINDSIKGISNRMTSPDGYLSQQLNRHSPFTFKSAITTTPTGKHFTAWVDDYSIFPPRLSFAYTTSTHSAFSGEFNLSVLPDACNNWDIYLDCGLVTLSADTLPDGTIGIVYVVKLTNPSFASQYNVMLTQLDGITNQEIRRISVTNYTQYSSNGAANSPIILNAHLAATPDNHLLIAWDEIAGANTNVYYRAYTNTGTPLGGSPATLIDLTTANVQSSPNLVSVAPDQVLIGYTITQPNVPSSIQYAVIGSDGAMVQPAQSIPEASGSQVDATLQFGGQATVAWKDQETGQVSYIILQQGSTWAVPVGMHPTLLPLRAGHEIKSPSLTRDSAGNAVITWGVENRGSLYYAVIGPDGSVITPPMNFMKPSDPYGYITTSESGEGSAPLDGIIIVRGYIPFIVR